MYIKNIHSPKELKQLSIPQLSTLADEIRHALLCKMSKVGGHVGPNLGMVELTIAMHYVFESPIDKFVFDTGHQCYTHKMLTGRAEAFLCADQFVKVSGYTNPKESEHDFFNVGHTSTAISLALGLCKGRDVCGGNENIVAIVGDGSLSGGECMEGLNCAGEYDKNLIIIINDNEQSIQENHGGIYKNLKLLRETHGQAELNLFKAQGLDYKYVEDGHSVAALVDTFNGIKDCKHPIVLHIHTEKGHGFLPAIEDKEHWHYHYSFDLETGKDANRTRRNYFDVTGDYLVNKAHVMPELVALAAGTCTFLGLNAERRALLGNQYVDCGIAEEHVVSMVSGIAKRGGSPVWGTLGSFYQRAYDQLQQDVCINQTPATFLVFWCTVFGLNDATHISLFDIPLLTSIPGLVYLAPTCCEEYLKMLDWAVEQRCYPVAIRVPGMTVMHRDEAFDDDYSALNTFRVEHAGEDVAIIAVGDFYSRGDLLRDMLINEGINATLINPRYLSGLDTKLLEELKEGHQVVLTMEDGIIEGGFGEKIARYYADSDMKVLVRGIKKELYDGFNAEDLLTENRLQPEQLVCDVVSMMK